MIYKNININENKLEEFIRILIREKYDILSHDSEEDIYVDVVEKEINEINKIVVFVKLVDKNNVVKDSTELEYPKISEKYFDQKEVMLKSAILKLFKKEKAYMWGTLIGVRPTKIVRRFLKIGFSYELIEDILKNIYFVSNEKIRLLIEIVKRQEKYIDNETIGVYIGVAFCPTKCSYCSFPAYLLRGKYLEKYNEYIESLYKEVAEMGIFLKELGLKINTIYVGGGTPSILTANEIRKLMNEINCNYDLSDLKEFTFEAGRIDTLCEEKIKILKEFGVTKISINPQSFNDKTLKIVNRYHNQEQFDNIYFLAKKYNLEINMDLIIGLPKENTEDIINTFTKILEYDMDNLTIHNLAIKNASKLNKENYNHEDLLDYKKIYNKIYEVTKIKNLKPYYMYRQKNSFQWGENIGYSKSDKESIYNIEMIEENKTIVGIGAGSITKLIYSEEGRDTNVVKRVINPKDPLVWINELDERLHSKKNLLKLFYEK